MSYGREIVGRLSINNNEILFDCHFEFVFNFSPTAKVISIRVHCLNSHQPMPVLI